MSLRQSQLFSPLNLAAFLAWAGTGAEVWFGPVRGTGLLAEPALTPTVLAMHTLFLALFVACLPLRSTRGKQALVWLQLALVLALLLCSRFGSAPVLLIVAVSQLAMLASPRQLALAFVASNGAFLLILQQAWHAGAPVLTVVLYASFQLFAILTSWYARSAQDSLARLATVNAELLATRSLLAESVRDSERLRLSRELHDVSGHKLTALKLNLAALARDPALAGVTTVSTCAALADELLGDIRGVVQQMRLHDGLDLRQALAAMAAPFPRPTVHLQLTDDARVADVAQAEALLRMAQEALTNAVRHGDADNLWIALRREPDGVILDVRDDGRGTDTLNFGNGLSGMRERLDALGGALRVERADGGGMRLSAWLPVAA